MARAFLVRRMRAAALAVGVVGVGGCVALPAALPLAASGVLVRKQMAEKRQAREAAAASGQADPAKSQVRIIQGMTALPSPKGAPGTPSTVRGAVAPSGMQYLYGSGEAAANSRQAYAALSRYVRDFQYRRPDSLRQRVISDGASLASPYFEPCGKKPLAIVLDIDETALLNLGYEADEARRGLSYDDARWRRWEAGGAGAVAAVPGAKEAIDQARKAGIMVVFNSNRTTANAGATEAALASAGLGPAKHGETLWLKGDDGGGSAKDTRRWAIASGYCVIALVGDQLGDFSDLFNDAALSPAQRRAATLAPQIAELWGDGWFVLPNPVYGTALTGSLDDIFPIDKRWDDK